MKTQIIEKGYAYYSDDKEAFSLIDIDNIEWSEKGTIPLQMCVRSDETQATILKLQDLLGEKYIKPAFGEYTKSYVDLVNGMDHNVYDWHNDYEYGHVNLGILMYFSSTDAEIGGGITFRDAINHVEHAFFYPQEGDILVVNHTTKFQHRVTKQNIPLQRIVGSFHYHVDSLN